MLRFVRVPHHAFGKLRIVGERGQPAEACGQFIGIERSGFGSSLCHTPIIAMKSESKVKRRRSSGRAGSPSRWRQEPTYRAAVQGIFVGASIVQRQDAGFMLND